MTEAGKYQNAQSQTRTGIGHNRNGEYQQPYELQTTRLIDLTLIPTCLCQVYNKQSRGLKWRFKISLDGAS